MDEPGPGSYQETAAFDYTVKKKDFVMQLKSTEQRTAFVDAQAKLLKYVPPIGHYNNDIAKGYAIRSKSRQL